MVSNQQGANLPPQYDKLQEQTVRRRLKRVLTPVAFFVLIPSLIAGGVLLFGNRSYNLIAAGIALIACVPFFVSFEKKQKSSRELMVIAVMTGISVFSRVIFAPIPGFKPVTAIIIISALSLGGEAGFMIGALSAIVSNISFGQGPWTPFQMFSWGAIGFLCGLIAKTGIMKKWWALSIAGVIGGVLYSLIMDIWTVLAFDGSFNLDLYLAAIVSALPWMAIYAASNIIFLLVLSKPIGQKLNRIKTKYEVFS